MKNIVLVGFMGTGKTTVARAVAKKLKMRYVSTDELIEKSENLSISDIFSEKGERHFREVEKIAVKEASGMQNAVIDAGGGVVMDPENIARLKKKGVIVCLTAAPEVILDRTKKYTHRPLLNVDDPLAKIKELIEKRKPFYARADYSIDTSMLPREEVVREIERVAKDAPENR